MLYGDTILPDDREVFVRQEVAVYWSKMDFEGRGNYMFLSLRFIKFLCKCVKTFLYYHCFCAVNKDFWQIFGF